MLYNIQNENIGYHSDIQSSVDYYHDYHDLYRPKSQVKLYTIEISFQYAKSSRVSLLPAGFGLVGCGEGGSLVLW